MDKAVRAFYVSTKAILFLLITPVCCIMIRSVLGRHGTVACEQ